MATVAELSHEMFGITPPSAAARFDEDGWSYEETIDSKCPKCQGEVHAMGKPYKSGGRGYRYAAFVCVACVKTFTLNDLGYTTRKALTKESALGKWNGSTQSAVVDAADDLPVIPTVAGLVAMREWESFHAKQALETIARIAARWGRPHPIGRAVNRVPMPGGGSISARALAGDAGSITALVAEHQRTLHGCVSSEVRVVQPLDGSTTLHIVTVECSEHSPGDSEPCVAAEVAIGGGLTVFGVDPYRVGNTTTETVARLVEMLQSADRNVPIVLLSGSNRAAEARGLTARLNGAALVATIDGDASWALSDSLGAALGCYAGAVRVYPPAIAGVPAADNPIWVSRRIAQAGWAEISRDIVATVLTTGQAPRRPRLEAELQRESASAALASASAEIQRLKAELRETRVVQTGSAPVDTELDAIFDAQNETIAKLETDLDDAVERNLELEAQLAESESTRQALQLALSHQRWQQSDVDDVQAVAFVDESVDAAIERMADPTGALVCTEDALRGWRHARYPDPSRMLDALRHLESAASEWRTKDAEVGGRLGDWIQNTTGLRYAGSDQELERRSLGSFHFEGRKWSRVPHIKVDDGKHSNQVGRIYFATDSSNRRWIVDHVGQKLYGR